jgi:hypothetical protein
MPRSAPALPAVLALAAAAAAAPPAVKLPAEATAAPGRIIRLAADTPGKAVCWAIASDDADLIPFPGGKVALFSSPKPGRYLVLAWTAAADEPGEAARCVVVVGDPPPGPPPTPPPGPPADPLRRRLADAYAADPDPGKGEARKDLAELYRQAAAVAADPAVRTAGELNARVRKAAESLAAGKLPGVKRIAGEELARALPADAGEDLTPTHRKAAADLFGRLAAALDSF